MRNITALLLFLSCYSVRSASDFSIILIPDTQYMLTADHQSVGSWIRTNAASINLQAVIGLGDIVDSATTSSQWVRSTNLYYQTASVVQTLPVIGNHDMDSMSTRGVTNFNNYYPQSFYTNQSGWSGGFYSSTSENWYWRHAFAGTNWTIFGLEYGPRDEILNWVSNTVAAYPNDKIAIFTHSNVRETGWQVGTDLANDAYNPHSDITPCNDGKETWNKTFRSFRNLFLVGNGHHLDCDDTQLRRSIAVGDYGNAVMQSMANYQSCLSKTWIRILTFHPEFNTCDATTYQTSTGTYNTNAPHQFSFTVFSQQAAGGSPAFKLNDLPFLSAAAQPKPLTSSLLVDLTAYWRLDESSGTRVDVVGTNNLTSINSVGSASGVITNAATFASASSRKLQAANSTSLTVSASTPFTISAWAKITSKGANRTIVCKGDGAVLDEYLLTYRNSADRWAFQTSSNTVLNASNFGSPSTNTWNHIVAWYDGSGNNIYISVNNGASNTLHQTSGAISGTNTFTVGSEASTGYMDGSIDEVGFWKRVLTPTERTLLYNSGAGLTYPFQ